MFSEYMRHYARGMILWTSFWVLTFFTLFTAWGYACYAVAMQFYPEPDTGRIPFTIAWLAGMMIIGISYFNILGKWQEERKEELERQKKARRYA